MHIDTIIAALKEQGHRVQDDGEVRLGNRWLLVDDVPMTELQARHVAIGRRTVEQIDQANRNKAKRSASSRPITRRR